MSNRWDLRFAALEDVTAAYEKGWNYMADLHACPSLIATKLEQGDNP
jgi:hypothetical protein